MLEDCSTNTFTRPAHHTFTPDLFVATTDLAMPTAANHFRCPSWSTGGRMDHHRRLLFVHAGFWSDGETCSMMRHAKARAASAAVRVSGFAGPC